MSAENQTLFETALALPEEARTKLVELLLDSLSPEPDTLTEEEFVAELERRSAEFERDPSVGIPWSDVKREL